MSEFSSDNQPERRGRPQGSKNKRVELNEKTINKAFKNIIELVKAGDKEASLLVVQMTLKNNG